LRSKRASRSTAADASVSPRFAGVATFTGTRRRETFEGIDIGLIGVPFDLGVNYRAGARQGLSGLRCERK